MIRILTVLQVLLRMHEQGQHVASHHHLAVKKGIVNEKIERLSHSNYYIREEEGHNLVCIIVGI